MVIIYSLSQHASEGVLRYGTHNYLCRLGRSGRKVLKREGDGATPIGCWPIRGVFYRPDRLNRPPSRLPTHPLRPDWGWCDAPEDRNYNRLVTLPYAASAEVLWRDDPLYDLFLVIGYNDRPRQMGRGSAIFLHVAPPEKTPTAGCVGLALTDLQNLVKWLRPGEKILIQP